MVDPRPFAAGSIRDTLKTFPHIGALLPAMGYGEAQVRDLEASINNTPCDLVLIASPVDLRRIMDIRRPSLRIGYELEELGSPTLADALGGFLDSLAARKRD